MKSFLLHIMLETLNSNFLTEKIPLNDYPAGKGYLGSSHTLSGTSSCYHDAQPYYTWCALPFYETVLAHCCDLLPISNVHYMLCTFIPHSHQKLSCFKSGVSYSSLVSLPINQEQSTPFLRQLKVWCERYIIL